MSNTKLNIKGVVKWLDNVNTVIRRVWGIVQKARTKFMNKLGILGSVRSAVQAVMDTVRRIWTKCISTAQMACSIYCVIGSCCRPVPTRDTDDGYRSELLTGITVWFILGKALKHLNFEPYSICYTVA
jgi:hypothetical protein